MRKLYLVLILIFAFVISSSAGNFQNKGAYTVDYSKVNKSELSLKFSLSKYSIQVVEIDGVKYSVIDFNHGVNTNLKGYAELPMLNATLQLESDNDVVLSVVEGNFIDIKLDYPILPSRGTIFRNQDPSSILYVIDPASIVDKFYPENIAESPEPFVFRDTRGVNIYTYPFRYNAAKNILRVYTDFSVVVKEDFSKSTNPLTIAPSNLDPAMNDVYKSLFINYNESKFENQIAQHGEMLVIYTSRDATAIQPYITWKRERGFIVHTLQVATNTNVKTNIQNAYNSNSNLLYVQLVGDWPDIKSDLGTGQTAPMDPMLGCVVGSDFYPELIIGRFSANTTAELTVQVNKTITYEKLPDAGATWYKNALGMARNEGAGQGDDGEGDDLHMERIRNRLLTPSYNYSTVYQEYDGNSTYAPNTTAATISSRLNSGVSVLNFCNHGLETSWSVGNYSASHVNALTNGSKLPFIFSVACVVGKFHRTTGDCFAETWLKKENGGAVVTIMSTINQPWIPPMRGQDYFNDILIGGYNYASNPGNGTSTTLSDKRTTFGSLTFNGNVLMLAEQYSDVDTRETFQTWTIFGDASLQIRTDTPTNMTIGHLPNVMVGPEFFEIDCNTDGAFGALTKNGVLIGAAYCTDGIINLPIAGLTIGDNVKLVVTAYNKIPHIIDLNVVAFGPFVNFYANKKSALCQEVIVFTDASGGGTFSSWAWNFGAGATPATATGQGPHNVTYSTVGQKNVTLLVNGAYERVKNNYITIQNTSFLTLSNNPPAGGIVNTNPADDKFLEGTYITLSPVANANYEFSHFSGDLMVLDNNCIEALPYTEPFSTNVFITGEPCWESQNIVGTNAWVVNTNTAYWKNTVNNNSSRMVAPPANIRNYSNVTLTFDLQRSGARIAGTWYYPTVTLEYWNGLSWVALQTYSGGTDVTMNTKTISLPIEAFTEEFKIGFRASAPRVDAGIWIRVDDFSLTGTWGLGADDIWLFMNQNRTVVAHFDYLGGSVLYGDVNKDGFINILDVVWMISHLNGSTPVGFDMDAADINEDSAVNLGDLTALLNLILITAK
jgi:hypothetical protein